MTSITLPRYKSTDGLAYCQVGEGMPLVFIHGVGLRAESWYQQIIAFKDYYSVFIVDMPGHGESDLLNEAEPRLYDYTEKFAKFIIDELQQPAVIIGHSMGALIALSLAHEYPELCSGVVAMNAIFKRSEVAKKAVHLRAESLDNDEFVSNESLCAPIARWFSEPLSDRDKEHAEMCREWLMSANIKGYSAAYKVFAFEDGPKSLSLNNFAFPTLFLTGEFDLNSNISMTKAMAIITPDAESVIVESSRHMTPLTHAEEVNSALLDFIKRRLEGNHS